MPELASEKPNKREIKSQRKEEGKNEGKWSPEEQARFMGALVKYGRNRNKIVEEVGTRSINSIAGRVSALKIKLNPAMEDYERLKEVFEAPHLTKKT